MLGNFLFFYLAVFYVGIMYGLEKLSIFMYLPYAAGLIAAKIVGPWILKRLAWSPLAYAIAWTEFFFIGPLDSKWFLR